ncbi:MAG: hypothetical protein AAB092_08555, partial [Chloroflexota bacterium]
VFAADKHGTYAFASFQEYVQSSFFLAHGLRCGADRLSPQIEMLGTTADCTNSNTTIKAEYNASGGLTYTIPIWVHEIRRKTGTLGTLVAGQVTSQITALNSAFAPHNIQFVLAGQTLSKNNNWYNDTGTYYNTLARDVLNNLNIYTNTASGNLGYAYVPNCGGVVATSSTASSSTTRRSATPAPTARPTTRATRPRTRSATTSACSTPSRAAARAPAVAPTTAT